MKTYNEWLVEQVVEFTNFGSVATPRSLATRRDLFLQKLEPYGGRNIRWKAAQLAQIIPALQFKDEQEAIRALRLAMTQIRQGTIPMGPQNAAANKEQPN